VDVRRIRLPLSSTRRTQPTYAKLLRRFDPRSRSPFQWLGTFFRPGSLIQETELWPDETFPRVPLILEFAGSENPGKGHNRHKSDNTVVLWRYLRTEGKFEELGRVSVPAGMWAMLLEPLVREAMAAEIFGVHTLDIEAIRLRISRVIAAELDRLEDGDRARVLTAVHDELGFRLADVGESGRQPASRAGWPSGTQKPLAV